MFATQLSHSWALFIIQVWNKRSRKHRLLFVILVAPEFHHAGACTITAEEQRKRYTSTVAIAKIAACCISHVPYPSVLYVPGINCGVMETGKPQAVKEKALSLLNLGTGKLGTKRERHCPYE
jgi:hypothetical protein